MISVHGNRVNSLAVALPARNSKFLELKSFGNYILNKQNAS